MTKIQLLIIKLLNDITTFTLILEIIKIANIKIISLEIHKTKNVVEYNLF